MTGHIPHRFPSSQYDPRLLQAYGYTTPYLNPLTAHAMKMEMTSPKPFIPTSAQSLDSKPYPTNNSLSTREESLRHPVETKPQVEQLRPSLMDPRRPLGTSALQNQTPLASPAYHTEKAPRSLPRWVWKLSTAVTASKTRLSRRPKHRTSPMISKDTSMFICKFCKKEFTLQRLLNRHLKCHSDVKRYLCTFCGKGFNDTFDLKRHTRIHTGVKPYKCPSCDKSFTQRCSLESHTRKVHGVELPYGYKQRRNKVYVCEDCGHSTHDPEEHFKHLQQNHPYNPAINRCHDKRQFKFKNENASSTVEPSSAVIALDEKSSENTERSRSDNEVAMETFKRITETPQRRSEDTMAVEGLLKTEESEAFKVEEKPIHPKHDSDNQNEIQSNIMYTSSGKPKMVDMSAVLEKCDTVNQTGVRYNDIRMAPKRPVVNSPKSSPVKRSPKQLKPSSPMKIRPLALGLCENSKPAVPRIDAENITGKYFNDTQIKKRPL
ncbi:OVO-like protein, partial [Mya arenaria]